MSAPEHPDIQSELSILLAAIGRETGKQPSDLSFEVETVARSALLAAFNKGFRRARRLSERALPAVVEEPAPPPARSELDPNAGLYLYVGAARKGTSK